MFENPQILTGTGGVGGQRIARTYRFHGLGRARSRRASPTGGTSLRGAFAPGETTRLEYGKRDQAGSSASNRATRPCTNQSRATASAARKTTFVAADGCDHHLAAVGSAVGFAGRLYSHSKLFSRRKSASAVGASS